MGSLIWVFIVFWITSCMGLNYTVTTVLQEQFVNDNGDQTYSGLMVDLMDKLAKQVGFSYKIKLNPDGKHGIPYRMNVIKRNPEGMIGELLDNTKDVHIAAAPFEISKALNGVVPLTRPFLLETNRILLKKPVVHPRSLNVLFEPFSLPLWIMVIVMCFVMSALLFIVNKFSPSEWSKVSPEDDPTNSRESFSAKNASFFVHSTLTWQGYKEVPRSPAGRILVTMWFSFIFFMVIAYIANLTAFFLARHTHGPVIPFKTFKEMTSQSTISYGAIQGMNFVMEESEDPLLKSLPQTIDTWFYSVSEAISKVRKSYGKFAAIVPSHPGSMAVNEEPCDLIMVGRNFLSAYGMACKSNDICSKLSEGILRLTEDGTLVKLQLKWFPESKTCSMLKPDSYVSKRETAQLTAEPLSISDASLAFAVLFIGVVFCLIFLIIEVLVHRHRKTKSENIKGNNFVMATEEEQAGLSDEKATLSKSE